MLDHIGLDVSDIKKAKEFFLKALRPLGYEMKCLRIKTSKTARLDT